MKLLKYLSFGGIALLSAIMVTATILEKYHGRPFVSQHIYGTLWFVLLWGLTATASLIFVIRRKMFRRPAVLALHLSFCLILAGALVTWIFGRQGTLHLRIGESICYFANREGHAEHFPFTVRLDDFRVEHYPGTQSPMDYVSHLCITSSRDSLCEEISMNHILRFKGYRFYQASYDTDRRGSTLSVSHDPWGIGLTYGGYALLLLSMLFFFFDKQSGFSHLLKHPALRKTACMTLFFGLPLTFVYAQSPTTLPRSITEEMGRLHVYYNGRICPLSTLSHDFCQKITNKDHYKNLDATQFMAGWLFFYDEWKEIPLIYIKSGEDRKALGTQGKYARLTDFRGTRLSPRSEEAFALIQMMSSQDLLKIFPYFHSETQSIRWASPNDRLPQTVGADTAVFIRLSINYLNELLLKQDYEQALSVLHKIGRWQERQAGDVLPSKARFSAEQLYYRINQPLGVAVFFLLTGMASFVLYCRRTASRKRPNRLVERLLWLLLCLGALYLSAMLVLRAWICGHWPMSNGYETMQMIAWCALMAALLFRQKFDLLQPLGFLVAGLAMMVSMMGSSNPQITPLMPVLSSPLLSVHVMLVMVSYTLFAFIMLNGVAGIWLHRKHKEASLRLAIVGRLMLYPAVFCLAAGIFIGAVWANVSWGRYWGWDPKEVWALITLLVYAFALHDRSLARFQRPVFFHIFSIAAFVCVIVTYFGVNFLLGGMHGYV